MHAPRSEAPAKTTVMQIDEPPVEAALARAIREFRGNTGSFLTVGAMFEGLLQRCLEKAPTWDRLYRPDALVQAQSRFTRPTHFEVFGQMVTFAAQESVEPFTAHVLLPVDDRDAILAAVLRFGDITHGLGKTPLASTPLDPHATRTWAFEFHKPPAGLARKPIS